MAQQLVGLPGSGGTVVTPRPAVHEADATVATGMYVTSEYQRLQIIFY